MLQMKFSHGGGVNYEVWLCGISTKCLLIKFESGIYNFFGLLSKTMEWSLIVLERIDIISVGSYEYFGASIGEDNGFIR